MGLEALCVSVGAVFIDAGGFEYVKRETDTSDPPCILGVG